MFNKQLLRRFFALAVLCATALTMVGCNTVEGAGKDIEKGGEKLKRAAE